MRYLLTLVLGGLLVASPVAAFTGWFKYGQPTPASDTQTTGSVNQLGERIVLLYDSGETGGTWSTTFDVMTISALFCFTPDIDVNGATAARVKLWMAPHTITDATSNGIPDNDNGSIDLGGANGNTSLDGTEGEAGTQNACLRIGPGKYFAEFDVACAQADETCRLTVTGE